jgi:hypothetical protein
MGELRWTLQVDRYVSHPVLTANISNTTRQRAPSPEEADPQEKAGKPYLLLLLFGAFVLMCPLQQRGFQHSPAETPAPMARARWAAGRLSIAHCPVFSECDQKQRQDAE